MTLEQRIQDLERSLRRFKLLSGISLAVVVLAAAFGFQAAQKPGPIVATKVSIIDQEGKTRGVLMPNGLVLTGRLQITDENRRPCAELGIIGDTNLPGMAVMDDSGIVMATIGSETVNLRLAENGQNASLDFMLYRKKSNSKRSSTISSSDHNRNLKVIHEQ